MTQLRGTSVRPLLRVPPFPGSRPGPFAVAGEGQDDGQIEQEIEAIRLAQVGGAYWARRPDLPPKRFTLVCVRDAAQHARIVNAIGHDKHLVSVGNKGQIFENGRAVSFGESDPWHWVVNADAVLADADDEISLISAIFGKQLRLPRQGGALPYGEPVDRPEFIRDHPALKFRYLNPFTGEPMALLEAVELCSFWKTLIDSNRPIVAAVGFAAWKRPTVGPLLWAGSGDVPFLSRAPEVIRGEQVAIWKSRMSAGSLNDLQSRHAHLVEVEDGFIRSVGLGADCVPPLSIVVDRLGAYFDPAQESELEQIIQQGSFSAGLLKRARTLRELIVEHGISKYGSASATIERRAATRRHLLVLGQVEDDRSVVTGGGPIRTNLDLLLQVRQMAPHAFITYKPHPDVQAGHRVGSIPTNIALKFADRLVDKQPISALIDQVDEVHVNTSLGGFEALLRGREVVVHGVPFYAGWGLTRDLGAVPTRRTAKRSVDELVAAVLLIYPRYLDPETRLPCPPEVLIGRLTGATPPTRDSMLVHLRRMQGRLMRGLKSLRRR